MLKKDPPPQPSIVNGKTLTLKPQQDTPAPTSIVVSLVPGANLGQTTVVQVQAGFVGRAVLFPPGSVTGVPADQYTFVAYATESAPATIFMPNVLNTLYADLPNGILPQDPNKTIFDEITAAIKKTFSPDPPTGTGNDHKP
jgi:hypothetical protein